ncbi:DUF1553 domain-containing protein [Tundrisphaera lichenicola]|uniref:DUF1553 domain-containing protein n=1 Tax=Tundrisphaera lichenicola TaxID=2029860 RepID=UPI003EB9A529
MNLQLALTCSAIGLMGLGASAFAAGPEDSGIADFERNVRPILVNRCYECHSAASKKSKGGLLLDTREGVREGGISGPAIVPGKPEESPMIRALAHTDPDLKMPPRGKLPDHEIAALSEWVRKGASDPRTGPEVTGPADGKDHWAFRSVTRPERPEVKDASWPRTPVDRFILAAIEAKGMTPAAPASRRTLIRRATFDLIGLPPTPDEVGEFVEDRSPDAWEKVVDRLLASPLYGERWGRHWLDVVRYADTAGETADYPVPEAYRYRNYVIRSFNEDKPYDRFIVEQIAGDILAREAADRGGATEANYAELVTATGFLAISRRFGFDTERYEHLTIQDSIDGVGQSVLGLSIGCARCHDHKFDPISARDYYALYGIFASTRYAFPGSERLPQVRAMVPLASPEVAGPLWKEWEAEIDRIQARLKSSSTVILRPLSGLDGDFELQAAPSGGSLGLPSNPWISEGGALIDGGAQSPFANVYPKGNIGVSFSGDGETLSFRRGLVPADSADAGGTLHFGLDFRFPGAPADRTGSYRIRLGDESGGFEMSLAPDSIRVKDGDSFKIARTLDAPANAWNQVQVSIDLRAKTFSGTVGTPGDLARFEGKMTGWDGAIRSIVIDGSGHRDGLRPPLQVDNLAVSESPLPAMPPPEGPAIVATEPAKPEEADSLEARLAELLERGPFPQAYAVWEGSPKDVPIQKRGEPERPGELAPRGFLPILGGSKLPDGTEGSGRLELARWLTAPENPLTSRVIVNRIWQHHFGRGLVATENDFGTRGRRPTHPELLDYLASIFNAPADQPEGLGWSIKRMHRLILLSNAYQTSGAGDPSGMDLDPANEWLTRFPRQRLEAEVLRDSILALSGGLDLSVPPGEGGQPPFPPLRQTKFSQHAPFLADYDTKRRSIYLMTARIRRHPFLALFDGPDTNASTARRNETTVPTQALFLMNDPFVHEQSAGFGRRLIAAASDDPRRIALGFEMALAREPSEPELAESMEFLRRYRRNIEAAGLPEDQRESLAWSGFARTLFARNEFFFVD